MKKWCLISWLLIYILFSSMPPAVPTTCPSCSPGSVLKGCRCAECEAGQYWSQRNGEARCNECTAHCDGSKYLIEVTACTKTSDRSCKCQPGYSCPSPVKLTCRRSCEPCINSFTSTSNLNRTCQKYTDCATLGMVVIKEGSPTSDRVCGNLNHTTRMPDTTTQRISLSTHKPQNTPSAYIMPSLQSPVTTAISVTSPERAQTAGENKGSVPPPETLPKTTWIILLLLLISLLCLVSCLSLKCKSKAIKDKLECVCPGLAYGRHQPMFARPNPDVVTRVDVPVSDSDTIKVQGQGSFRRENQQVTMEHVGKADGINNTVGSIFIYSPGMVILGSNSNEKKEEAETSGEDSSEDTRLMSVPQQESSSEEDSIRFATQEELGKELSIPIPATSK